MTPQEKSPHEASGYGGSSVCSRTIVKSAIDGQVGNESIHDAENESHNGVSSEVAGISGVDLPGGVATHHIGDHDQGTDVVVESGKTTLDSL